jgi:tetratricopeptide (TPR) repeat protein
VAESITRNSETREQWLGRAIEMMRPEFAAGRSRLRSMRLGTSGITTMSTALAAAATMPLWPGGVSITTPEPAVRELVAMALLNKGVALRQLGQLAQEIAVYEELERRFAQAPEPGVQEQVAKALLNKGVALGQLGEPAQAIAAYEELERRFAQATEPALREQVARARDYKAKLA